MEADMVKVTAKGQISIPRHVQEKINLQKGDKLVMVTEGDTITMKKATDTFKDLHEHSAQVAKKLWSSEVDDVWDEV
jgi:AbrB family looped-hinge helix DNA binding protein